MPRNFRVHASGSTIYCASPLVPCGHDGILSYTYMASMQRALMHLSLAPIKNIGALPAMTCWKKLLLLLPEQHI